MPLAGRMKLRTFLLLAGVVAAVGVVGLYKACDDDGADAPAATTPALTSPPGLDEPRRENAKPVEPEPPVEPTGAAPDLAARPYDAEVLAWRGKTVAGGKRKDASKGKAYKINVYQDAGNGTANRAKVDLDRDDRWDEKYTFEDGKVTLQRAPADDEQYTETYVWADGGWLAASADGAAERPPTTAPAPGETTIVEGGVDLAARPHDREVIAWQDRSIAGGKQKDALRGRSFKVNVYQDAGHAKVNRAKVDLDRDDKWDEKYTFEDGRITLQRAPADDEQYTETFHWTGDGWGRAE